MLFNLSHYCNISCREGLKEDNSQFKSVICEVCAEKGLYFTGRGKQGLMADDQRHRRKPYAMCVCVYELIPIINSEKQLPQQEVNLQQLLGTHVNTIKCAPKIALDITLRPKGHLSF